MSVLFNQIVFGPIKSRRFGESLGINLLPLESKICNFDCIYCECGWTDLKANSTPYFSKETILADIKNRFKALSARNIKIDSITFAGNGEPTMHPHFSIIIDDVILLRNQYFPGIKIVVLSNATLLSNKKVFSALQKVDLRVLKLDAGTQNTFEKINKPLSSKKNDWYVNLLKKFKGKLNLQTIFLRGSYNQSFIDNTLDDEVAVWLESIKEINPESVMIYTINRETPVQNLEKISEKTLNAIANKVKAIGIDAQVYY